MLGGTLHIFNSNLHNYPVCFTMPHFGCMSDSFLSTRTFCTRCFFSCSSFCFISVCSLCALARLVLSFNKVEELTDTSLQKHSGSTVRYCLVELFAKCCYTLL